MPELVACPLCNCRILVNEMQLGHRIRCIGCERTFVAGELAPISEPTTYALHPSEVVDEEPEEDAPRGTPALHRSPLCPKCHRPVDWKDRCCAHCGRLFNLEDGQDRASWHLRRDAVAHRGELVRRLGGYALLGGCLTICTGPLGALLAVGCGGPAWWMAHHDLADMAVGRMDPAGREATEAGKHQAVGGLSLGLISSIVWILFIIDHL